MCTVTLIPRHHGFVLGMNRDESLKRVAALPSVRHQVARFGAVFPSEPAGGTWIGLNDSGAAFALLNNYSVSRQVSGTSRSRGRIVRSALGSDSPRETHRLLLDARLARVNPFRLIGVYPAANEVVEWRWDLSSLKRIRHRWTRQLWASSGFDDPGAQRARRNTFRRALEQSSAGSLDWLRRLHRSHAPERGAYSLCMHRRDAATLSYTEIRVQRGEMVLRYLEGAPCSRSHATIHKLA